ncbi:MAG: biopolymer transporter ExbD [bacterium]|nr:biopolymer transporter ExbD [bacterium]
MAIKGSKGKDAMFTEINITPLTDIFLVLLIIMMVVAPTFQSNDSSINVPEINSGVTIEQKNATVSVTKEGNMFINGKPISPDNLVEELLAIKDTLEKKEVVVKADEMAKSSEIMSIMDAAKEAEYTKLILAGEPLSKKEQKTLEEAPQQYQQEQEVAPQETSSRIAPDDSDWKE